MIPRAAGALFALSPDPAIFAGTVLNWALFGTLWTQLYVYYICFPKDSKHLKILVYCIFALEVAQTIIITTICWSAVSFRGDLEDLSFAKNLSWFGFFIIEGIIAAPVQVFYSWRIKVLGGTWPIVGLILSLTLAKVATSIVVGVLDDARPVFVDGKLYSRFTLAWLFSSLAVDTIIAGTMTYLLFRRRTIFHDTNVIITRLIRLSIETGLATVIVTIIAIASLYSTNLNFGIAYYSCIIILPKMYSNSFLMVLNNRLYMDREAAAKSLMPNFNSGNSGRSQPQRNGVVRSSLTDRVSNVTLMSTIEMGSSEEVGKETNNDLNLENLKFSPLVTERS